MTEQELKSLQHVIGAYLHRERTHFMEDAEHGADLFEHLFLHLNCLRHYVDHATDDSIADAL